MLQVWYNHLAFAESFCSARHGWPGRGLTLALFQLGPFPSFRRLFNCHSVLKCLFLLDKVTEVLFHNQIHIFRKILFYSCIPSILYYQNTFELACRALESELILSNSITRSKRSAVRAKSLACHPLIFHRLLFIPHLLLIFVLFSYISQPKLCGFLGPFISSFLLMVFSASSFVLNNRFCLSLTTPWLSVNSRV